MHTEYKSIYSIVYIFAVYLQSLTSINKENILEENTTLSLHTYILYYLDVSVYMYVSVIIYILDIYYCTCICVVDV